MKKHTIIISFILILMLTMSIATLPASAALPPLIYGDTNWDGIDITDATYVQRYIAKLEKHDPYKFVAGNVDGDNVLSVFDATLIQKYLAKEIVEFPAGDSEFIDISASELIADYGSGKAQVGTPITFTATASGFMAPFVYNFYVDGELVKGDTTDNTFEYTFDTVGAHSVGYSVTNRVGICSSKYITYSVGNTVTPDGSLTIKNLYHYTFYGNGGTFVVDVCGGKGEYMYSYMLLKNACLPDDYGEFIFEHPFTPYKINGEYKNTFTIDYDFEHGGHYALIVTVEDENGDVVSDILEFDYILPPPA